MNQPTTQLFSLQLGRWAEALLARGRSPLRRMDLHPPLLTAAGERHPALVLWINRDSLMAGGLILDASNDSEPALEGGRLCAAALGLRHFASWGPATVTIWQNRQEGATLHRTLAAPRPGSDDSACSETLEAVVEELQYLAVANPVPPGELSAHYLANLCRVSLDEVQSSLAESVRVACSEARLLPSGRASLGGRDKALITLLRLLALLRHELLPPAVQPQGLERALFFALDNLPQELRRILVSGPGEVPLTPEAAVRFHHLLRRLIQLGCHQNHDRFALLIKLLLADEAPHLGGFPLPADLVALPEPWLVVNPDGAGGENPAGEIGAPPLLALLALRRQLEGSPPAQVQGMDPFALPGQFQPRSIVGTLHATDPLAAAERKILVTQLRSFWPTRRFDLPSSAPRWVWEFLHLAGLVAEGGHLALRTPGNWLSSTFAGALLQLLRDRFSIEELRLTESNDLVIHCTRSRNQAVLTRLVSPMVQRRVDWTWLRQGPLSRVPLALQLPDRVFTLLSQGLLVIPSESTWPTELEPAILTFIRSGIGRSLWRLLAGGKPLPSRYRLRPAIQAQGLPLPQVEILHNLQNRCPSDTRSTGHTARVDEELAHWFGVPIDIPAPAETPGKAPAEGRPTISFAALQSTLQAEVFSDGIPRFPEQYLYAHFRPLLTEYRFTPPLGQGEEFFGRITLLDASGQRFEVPSSDTALALRLAAAAGRRVLNLPIDQTLLTEILGRYLMDLRELQGRLLRRAHAQIEDPALADLMVRRVWQGLKLPPPELFAATI
jgi:hypothetical protein